jgi:choline transporter-like protein 2/4/5
MSSVPEGFDVKKLKDRNYKGEDFNVKQELGKGPFGERKCTDLLCCLFFTLFVVGMAILTGYGYANGDPDKLISPIDGDGKICGVTPGYEDYQYLFIADIAQAANPATSIFDYGVCVKECPKTAD